MKGQGKFDVSPGTVDDGGQADDLAAGLLDNLDDLQQAGAPGDDILGDDHLVAFVQGKAPPDHHLPVLAFGEDKSAAQGAGDLVANQDAAHGGADDQVVGGVGVELSHGGAHFTCQVGKLQKARALEIPIAVQAAAQKKMSTVQGAQFSHQGEDLVFRHGKGGSRKKNNKKFKVKDRSGSNFNPNTPNEDERTKRIINIILNQTNKIIIL